MSANNYTICPRCYEIAQKEKARLIRKVNEAYGRVSKEEYEGLLWDSQQPVYVKPTLREDYEIGIRDRNIFTVKYSASCRECRFSFKFEETKNV